MLEQSPSEWLYRRAAALVSKTANDMQEITFPILSKRVTSSVHPSLLKKKGLHRKRNLHNQVEAGKVGIEDFQKAT